MLLKLLSLIISLFVIPAHIVAQPQGAPLISGDLALFFDPEELYVESASRMKENASEAPAVVNIITGEQIRSLGARNLMDVLITIPGFTEIQDTNEKVVVGRGVFATTTHKFLLLRDGHRLNEPMFEEMVPANSISLANIKRIEVLRGTGASLYGNSSLLGIINIVTLDRDASSYASVTGGNFGQLGVDFGFNEKLDKNRQLLFFGSVRNHNGETVNLPANQDMAANPVAGSQKVEARPFNFDIGLKYKGSESQISLSARRSSYDTPRSNDGAFLTVGDILNNPVQVFDFQHLDVQFLPRWKDIDFTLRHYADRSLLRTPQYVTTARDAPPHGKAFDLRIESARAGVDYSGVLEHQHGSLIAGIQFENFWLLDSAIETSFADNATMTEFPSLAKTSEWNLALYMQEKYHVTANLIFNAGLRWDYYESFGSSLNPRFALVYNPVGSFFIKVVYGRAFQAPSYFYRTENLGLGYGSPTGLRPEKLDNYQLSVENTFGDGFWVRVSAYHNRVKDLIARPAGAATYQNLGRLTTRGIESELKIKVLDPLEVFVTHSLQWALAGKTDAELLANGALANIPRQTATAGLTWQYAPVLSGSLYANWHSSIASPIIGPTPTQSDSGYRIPAATLVNFTLNADKFFGGMRAQLSVHNLFDKRDWRGGTTRIPYPQEGRSFLFTVGSQF